MSTCCGCASREERGYIADFEACDMICIDCFIQAFMEKVALDQTNAGAKDDGVLSKEAVAKQQDLMRVNGRNQP